jgi:hypothetical protein
MTSERTDPGLRLSSRRVATPSGVHRLAGGLTLAGGAALVTFLFDVEAFPQRLFPCAHTRRLYR